MTIVLNRVKFSLHRRARVQIKRLEVPRESWHPKKRWPAEPMSAVTIAIIERGNEPRILLAIALELRSETSFERVPSP